MKSRVVIGMMQEAKWGLIELIQKVEQTKNLVKLGKEKSTVFGQNVQPYGEPFY